MLLIGLQTLQFNDGLTYMDWTFKYTGLDLSYVWDPEMWIKFREAVRWNTPEVFWNKLWDRISYSKLSCRGALRVKFELLLFLHRDRSPAGTQLQPWEEADQHVDDILASCQAESQ